jgi:hypothetical protein
VHVPHVAVAETRRLHPHDDLTRSRLRGHHISQPQWTADLIQYPSSHESPNLSVGTAIGTAIGTAMMT